MRGRGVQRADRKGSACAQRPAPVPAGLGSGSRLNHGQQHGRNSERGARLMKICLCYPALTPGQKSKYGLQPLGVLYIGALLRREGFEVEVLDADIDGLSIGETVRRILEMKPDLVGFSLMT